MYGNGVLCRDDGGTFRSLFCIHIVDPVYWQERVVYAETGEFFHVIRLACVSGKIKCQTVGADNETHAQIAVVILIIGRHSGDLHILHINREVFSVFMKKISAYDAAVIFFCRQLNGVMIAMFV